MSFATISRCDPQKHDRQYNHIYFCRLAELGIYIRKAIEAAGYSTDDICKIVSLRENVDSIVIGSLFYDLKYVDDNSEPVLREISSIKASNEFFLEDDSARIKIDVSLIGPVPFTTGLTMGILGRLGMDGVLRASRVFWAGNAPHRCVPTTLEPKEGILIISDITCSALRLHALQEFLSGEYVSEKVRIPAFNGFR